MNVLIIDNYDSFTFNLYQYIGEILQTLDSDKPANVIVKRNDEITLADVQAMNLNRIIISPGPGAPDDPAYFGICAEVIKVMGKTTPLLGVCLGMQGIAYIFGGDVIRASVPMHGKVSSIRHNGAGVYQGLPQELEIMRYHSLMVQADTLPDCLTVTAIVANDDHTELSLTQSALAGDEIMGLQHKDNPIQGMQFHTESFATEGAKRLLTNFLLQV
jgi:anthranilate synthase component 2